MNLKELKQLVDRMCEYTRHPEEITVGVEVCIPGSIGGTPIVGIDHIGIGIDWDKNKCIIKTTESVRKISSDEIRQIRQEDTKNSMLHYELQNLKRENSRLRKRIENDNAL